MLKTFEHWTQGENIDSNYKTDIPIIDSTTGEVIFIDEIIFDILEDNNVIYVDENIDKIHYLYITAYEQTIKHVMFLVDNDVTEIEINHKGQFTILQDVDLSNLGLKSLDIPILEVEGDYDISYNNLEKLHNSPVSVYGDFIASENSLKDLYGGPKYVYGNFNVSDNFLKTFEGGPENVTGLIDVSDNYIEDLDSFGGFFNIKYLPSHHINQDKVDEYFIMLYNQHYVELKDIDTKISNKAYKELTGLPF